MNNPGIPLSLSLMHDQVIALVAISVPYATDEVSRYIATPHPALSVASAGYIVILVSQVNA